MSYLPEPFRIKMIEPIKLIDNNARKSAIKTAGYNLFNLRAEDVFIDMLTDSGTGSMSQFQWAAMMTGDESYAGAKSFFRFKEAMDRIFAFEFFVPTHQGRAAENILVNILVKPGQFIPSNMHFDTTEGNIRAGNAIPINLVNDQAYNPENLDPFKGNMDLQKLREFIISTGAENIPFGTITITNNAGGGQPVSLENIHQVADLYHEFGILFFIDACRFAENAYFIKQREPGYQHKSILSIAQEIFNTADGAWMSAKKDALVNIGGFLAVRNESLYQKICNELILREGFISYGGLAGRDLDAIAVGLYEGLEEDYLAYRVGQTAYLAEKLSKAGIPIMHPAGGHAVYIDAGKMMPHIPPGQFPGQTLAVALYVEGAVRGVEIGSVMFAHPDPNTGKMVYPKLELVRLAIPRRVYTQSHLDYVVQTAKTVFDQRTKYNGFEFTYAPELMRHFTARFKPL